MRPSTRTPIVKGPSTYSTYIGPKVSTYRSPCHTATWTLLETLWDPLGLLPGPSGISWCKRSSSFWCWSSLRPARRRHRLMYYGFWTSRSEISSPKRIWYFYFQRSSTSRAPELLHLLSTGALSGLLVRHWEARVKATGFWAAFGRPPRQCLEISGS